MISPGGGRKGHPLHSGSKHNAEFTVMDDMRWSIMRPAIALMTFSVLGFASPSGASAQPGRGALGAQSRAEVRISVSVLPRFEARRAPEGNAWGKEAGGIALRAINAHKLRYSVVRLGPDGPVLVVPD